MLFLGGHAAILDVYFAIITCAAVVLLFVSHIQIDRVPGGLNVLARANWCTVESCEDTLSVLFISLGGQQKEPPRFGEALQFWEKGPPSNESL